MDEVMNNNDLRRVIWSYLRKKPKISCYNCKNVCVWDKKRIRKYFYITKEIDSNRLYVCDNCWTQINYLLSKNLPE